MQRSQDLRTSVDDPRVRTVAFCPDAASAGVQGVDFAATEPRHAGSPVVCRWPGVEPAPAWLAAFVMLRRAPMAIPHRSLTAALLVSAAAELAAQNPAAATPRGQLLIEVTQAAANEYVAGAATYQHGACPTRNGALFVVVVRTRFAGPERTGVATSDLELWRSDDRGASWQRAASTPTLSDGDGAIVPDGEQLACTWSAYGDSKWTNVYAQRFDVAKNEWIGAPEQLTKATGDEDQYFTPDIARTANGTLVVSIGCHRSPPNPPWSGGWSTGMRALPPGAAAWTPLQQVNGDSYGVAGNLLARGDLVDFTYRNNPGWSNAVHGLRSFDAAKMELLAIAPPITSVEPEQNSMTANTGILCSDSSGGRSLLHLVGNHQAGQGRLAVSFARGEQPFRTVDLIEDPPLHAGNENSTHFTLARGPGNQVWAYFGKASEQFANLWQCLLEDGVAVGAPRIVLKGEPQQFALLGGMRTDGVFCGLHAVVTARTPKQPGGVVSVFGSWPSRTIWLR
jgi:hypothetical protein